MVVGSSPVAVTKTSDFATASSKEFLDIQATVECGFTLKRVRDMIRTYSYKDEFLKLYDEIIKNGEFSINTKNGPISSNTFKIFLEDILSGKIKDNEAEDYIEGINNIEEKLNKLIKSKEKDKLKNYITKINYSVYEKDKERIKTDRAKSFKDQKGKGNVNLPIALSKINTNNSSKELINNINQLINDLYNTKQITEQVYNILNRSITYVQSTNVYDIYKNDS